VNADQLVRRLAARASEQRALLQRSRSCHGAYAAIPCDLNAPCPDDYAYHRAVRSPEAVDTRLRSHGGCRQTIGSKMFSVKTIAKPGP
jgi:hypothetical protein